MENQVEDLSEIPELSHSDKIIGLFSEPKKTFEKMSGSPKAVDWLLPVSMLLIIVVLSRVIIMNNPDLAFQIKQQQIEKMDKALNSAVEKGQMTPAQKEDRINTSIENMNKPIFQFLGYIGIVIGGFIFFFIITGIYFLFLKFALKGEGGYSDALVVNGMTAYIGILQVILATILSYVLGRIISDMSIASLMNSDKNSIFGYILSKLDIITIWTFIILSIGYSKMFKSKSIGKYYGMVFGLWIFWCVFSFWLSKTIPWLNFMS
jgi:hypothetical protein